MLDLDQNELVIVTNIFKSILNNKPEIYVFGSRAKNTARKYSDLDLLIKANEPINYLLLSQLEEAFSESDLPYKTDIIDWYTVNEDFKQHITPQLIQIL
jgi:predicted nucleotidyltransferase